MDDETEAASSIVALFLVLWHGIYTDNQNKNYLVFF